MCRIAAIVSENTHTLLDRIDVMTKTMAHGGPDDKGHYINETLGYALGHRRLSIIDTSALGHQPMISQDKRYVISFNGEIYNYAELKKELILKGCVFNTASDTEILLHGYGVWGISLLTKLKGMFAFVLVDNTSQKLIAARDHMGIKPLYVAKRAGDIYFSSEVKAFNAVYEGWEPNMDWRVWFLTFGFLPEPITTLKNVRPVKKGHYILYDLEQNTCEEKQWYHRPKNIHADISVTEAVQTTRSLIEKAVERHLVSDVEVGVFLSGGIDSSIITLLASKANEIGDKMPIKALSIEFEDAEYSEKIYQEQIAALAGTEHCSLLVTQHDFAKAWEDIHASLDQPTTDAINNYFICRFAKEKGCKVVLSGLGADELFGGYPSFNRTGQIQRLKNLSRLQILKTGIAGPVFNYPTRKIDYFKKQIASSEYLTYRGLFTPADTAKILHITEKEVWRILSSYKMPYEYDNLKGAKNKVSAFECDVYMLNQLLKDADMQSMWHSVELRVPFLDVDVISYMHQLPENIKYPAGGHKYLLVKAFKDILPANIVNRKKQGFVFPIQKWLGKMTAMQNDLLVPEKYYNKFKKGNLSFSRLWGIYLSNAYGSLQNFTGADKIKKPTTLFMYLSAFSQTGGIEKVNRLILQALEEKDVVNSGAAIAYGLYDSFIDDRYTKPYYTKGFSGKTIFFLCTVFMNRKQFNRVIVGHLNLAPAVWIMKIMHPSLKITVMTHGIEAWHKQKGFKKWLLQSANNIISVSNYTRQQLMHNNIDGSKIAILPNALDPYFKMPDLQKRLGYLKRRYHLAEENIVLLTIARMSSTEQYKGYDMVLCAIADMPLDKRKNIKYILAGKYDTTEFARIQCLIETYKLQDHVIIPGYIEDDEIQDHYQLANLFLMPSKMEGFGIVLIESFASGTYVVAGNSDGSKEALRHGEFGQLIDPTDIQGIKYAIESTLLSQPTKQAEYNIKYKDAYDYYDPTAYKKNFNKLAFA
jgi:asparagine synthase (glutamine-hydrolysing)